MVESPEVKEQKQRLKELQVQISAVKKELNRLNKEKESWYSKKSALNKQISNLIQGVKGSKDTRNEMTEMVKSIKNERNAFNKEIAMKVKDLKDLKKKYEDQVTKHHIKEDPTQIKKRIEKLDYTIQTEPMSFDKEQRLMKEMKMLKKQANELKGVSGEWEKISTLSKDVNKLRKKANKIHRDIQKIAAESQEEHEDVITKSKEIDGLKDQEKAAFEKFKEYKEMFAEKNNHLKTLLSQVDEVKKILEEHNVQIEEDQRKIEQKELKKKAKEVSEKVKTGKKLTTEDLLIFQKSMGK